MHLVKPALAIFVGLLVGITLVGGVQYIGHSLFPVPPIEGIKAEDLPEFVANISMPAKLAVVLSWGAGMLGGSLVALWASGWRFPSGAVVLYALLALTAMNFVMIPHPVWMMVAPFVLVFAVHLVLRRYSRPQPR